MMKPNFPSNLLQNTAILFTLVISLVGCDTLNAFGSLVSVGLSSAHQRVDMPVESADRVRLIADEFYRHNSGMYGNLFKTYTTDELLIQPIEGEWSHDVVLTKILVKNLSSRSIHIALGESQFLPEKTHKERRNIGKGFSPYISIVYKDDNTPSIMTVPRETPEERPFQPTNKRRLGWDLVENVLGSYYYDDVDKITRGDISTIYLSPGSSVAIVLVFRVGFLKEGRLNLVLDQGKDIYIGFTEMGYFEAQEYIKNH